MKFEADRFQPAQDALLNDILRAALGEPDARIADILAGSHLVAVESRRAGLCARMGAHGQNAEVTIPDMASAHALARQFAAPGASPEMRSFGLAAINSLLPVPTECRKLKAQELLTEKGRGKNVAVIGHFPFVERVRHEFANFWVLERSPRPGDLPAAAVQDVIPRADVVALTATTLLNGTLASLLALLPPQAFTLMLGPSTPFAPALFDLGIDVLCGSVIFDKRAAFSGIRSGMPYRRLRGIRALTWEKA